MFFRISSPETRTRLLWIALAVLVVGVGIAALSFMHTGPRAVSLVQKVSATAPLQFTFPEDMNKDSAKEHLVPPDEVKGDVTWRGETLVFTPNAPLTLGQTYVFRMERTAKKADGTLLGQDLDFSFTVTGAPTLSASIPPKDTADAPLDATITLVFDRPMIPLAIVGDPARAPKSWPVTITPAVKGTWKWLSTYAVEFSATTPLTPATRYHVAVPTGLETASGEKTEADFSFDFVTMRPHVESSEPPAEYSLAGPATPLVVHFNQEMDLLKAPQFLKLERITKGAKETVTDMPVTIRYGSKELDGKKVTDTFALSLTPAQPLAFGATYRLHALPGIPGKKGDLGMEKDWTSNFSTVGPLTITNGGLLYGGIHVEFSNPVSSGSLKGAVSLSPVPKNFAEAALNVDPWSDSRTLTMYPNLAPSTTYTLTVSANAKDVFGQSLGKDFKTTFTTPQLTSDFSITNSKGNFAIFEKAKVPVYHVSSMNVKEIHAALAPLPIPTLLRGTHDDHAFNQNTVDVAALASAVTWTIAPGGKLNESQFTLIDAQKKLGHAVAPGLYVMSLESPEVRTYENKPMKVMQYFAVTNMAMTLKFSGTKALVWVTDMTTGDVIKDAAITFYSLAGDVVVQGKTDTQGFFESVVDMGALTEPGQWQPDFYVTAEKGTDISFVGSTWSDMNGASFDGWFDFRGPREAPVRADSFIYTDRTVYKGGDTVGYKIVTRLRDKNGVMTSPKGKQTYVTLQDPDGKILSSETLTYNAFGTTQGTLTLAKDAPLGSYSIQIKVLPEDQVETSWNAQSFLVAAYRKPEFKLDLTPASADAFDGDTVHIGIAGSYYFGAPLAKAKVKWMAQTTDYFFNKYTDGYYSFGPEDVWCYYNCQSDEKILTEGNSMLDEAGRASIQFPVDIHDKRVSQILTVEANVTDTNNQFVSGRVSFPVHKASVYVGVKTEEYAVNAGSALTTDLVTLTVNGKPQPSTQVIVSLYSREWNSIEKKGVDGEYYFDNEPKDTFISKQTVTTGSDGKTSLPITLPKGGQYMIRAEAQDSSGRTSVAETGGYAFDTAIFNWPHSNNDSMDVKADKPEYKPGDVAKLLVETPFQGKGVKALVTVEREGIMEKHIMDVTSSALAVEVPITEEMVPNVYVSVVVVKPRMGQNFDQNGIDTGVPAFKIGYVKLNVLRSSKNVQVKITTDKERYLPHEKVTVTLHTSDSKGAPIPAEVSLSAVDLSLLALTGYDLPDLLTTFYSDRGLGVQTSPMLRYVADLYKPGKKGGGGGEPTSREARGEFKDTAYWNPSIVTKADGTATVSFTLPDNLTTWKLSAIAATQKNTFGSAEKDILATKKVILRPVQPRFAVTGDRITVGALVHNFLDTKQPFTVALAGKGFTVDGSAKQTVTIEPDAQGKAEFHIVVADTGSLSLTYSAVAGNDRDIITQSIPVYPYGTPQAVATMGQTDDSANETIVVPTTNDAPQGNLTVSIAPSMAVYLQSGLIYLAEYPYGCAEQVASSFFGNVALASLETFGDFSLVNRETLKSNIEVATQKLYGFQGTDGGFSYFGGIMQSSPSLTAYVVSALTRTKQEGFTVDQTVLDKAFAYLQGALRQENMKNQVDLAMRAEILFVLAENGRGDRAATIALADSKVTVPLFAKAYTAMALQDLKETAKAKKVMDVILASAKVDARGTHFEETNQHVWDIFMNSTAHTTALVTQALVRIQPTHPLMPQILRSLLSLRIGGHWDTTQSTAQSILALVDYVRSSGELSGSYKADVTLNGKNVLSATLGKGAVTRKEVVLTLDQMKRGKENTLTLIKNGEGKLYYDALLSYFRTSDDLPAQEEGMGITRDITPLTGASKDLTVGTTYRVTLTMTVPEERQFVAVSSPLPAGLELIDQTFQTTSQLSQENAANGETSTTTVQKDWWWTQNWFTHTEFRDDQAFLFAETLPAGVYHYSFLVRATTPGAFLQRPTRIFEMYKPEVFGQTNGQRVTIGE